MKWQNGSYSKEELNNMQQDAMARVREMQRRADENLRRSNAALTTAPPESPAAAPTPPSPPLPTAAVSNGGKLNKILSAANIDNDRLILLGLLLILYNEGADRLLLLALLYVFL